LLQQHNTDFFDVLALGRDGICCGGWKGGGWQTKWKVGLRPVALVSDKGERRDAMSIG
jgi:hypothetical protein